MAALDLILGPILMGTIVNVLLLGIMLMQCYVYFERFKNDKFWMRPLVWFLLFLDCLSSSFDVQMVYDYLVTNFGNYDAIAVTNTGIKPYPILTGITALVVQCFFAWRIKKLIQSALLAYTIVALSFVQMLASIGTMVGGIIVEDFASLEKLKQISLLWLFGSVVTDIIITISLVWFLRRSKTGFNTSTDHLTDKIARLTLQTGLLTTTFAMGVAIAYLASQSTMHLAFGLPLSKIYTNSLMSSLNSRKAWNPNDYLSKAPANQATTFRAQVVTDTTIYRDSSITENLELHLVDGVSRASVDASSLATKASFIV